MRKKAGRIWRSFKTRILLSFFAFIRIFIVWICIYFFINNRQTRLDHFTNHLAVVQNHYAESNRYLQNFILTGFHQPSFYTSGKQKDIDYFEAEQDSIVAYLGQLKEEAQDNHISIDVQLQSLVVLHTALTDSVKLLKQLYYQKGFKDYGAEGEMRRYAHFIEDSCPVLKIDILMMRRREKDYMLRNEQKYIDEFNAIADDQAEKFASSPVTSEAILNYKKYFNEFAGYTQRLDLNSENGVYGQVLRAVRQLDSGYLLTNKKVVKEVSGLNDFFKIVLIVTFLLLVLAAIYLSIALSNNLTKDIKKLNRNVGAYVNSGFKDEAEGEGALNSKITEVQSLTNGFMALKHALKQTLANMQSAITEEKKTSARHEATIAKLREELNKQAGKSKE